MSESFSALRDILKIQIGSHRKGYNAQCAQLWTTNLPFIFYVVHIKKLTYPFPASPASFPRRILTSAACSTPPRRPTWAPLSSPSFAFSLPGTGSASTLALTAALSGSEKQPPFRSEPPPPATWATWPTAGTAFRRHRATFSSLEKSSTYNIACYSPLSLHTSF